MGRYVAVQDAVGGGEVEIVEPLERLSDFGGFGRSAERGRKYGG
jgi:hypothetical protein